MRALRKLNPGEKGTKKFRARYNEPLFCVRYRYDAKRRKRFTTVELILDEANWTSTKMSTIVGVRMERLEVERQRRLNQVGGKWNRAQRVQETRYDKAVVLELTTRIVPEERSISSMANRSK